jgi:hypothetical protein
VSLRLRQDTVWVQFPLELAPERLPSLSCRSYLDAVTCRRFSRAAGLLSVDLTPPAAEPLLWSARGAMYVHAMNRTYLPTQPSDPSVWESAVYSFLAEKERRSGSQRTVHAYSAMLRQFFGQVGKTPDEVTSQDVFSFAHDKGLSGRNPSFVTIAARIACVSSFYKFLIRYQMLAANPCDAIERPKTQPSTPRGLNTDEVRRLLAVIPDTVPGRRDRAIILTLLLTARRRTEVLSLKAKDITLQEGRPYYRYRGKGGKTGRRELPRPAYHLTAGRNPANCERFDVVDALGEGGFPVERLACGTVQAPRCPVRRSCRYYSQFEVSGTWVGSAEQLFNTHFINGASLIVLDDADLQRALISIAHVSVDQLADAREQLATSRRRKAAAAVGRVLQHAIVDAPDGLLIGPPVWDHLANVAAQHGSSLDDLICALPKNRTVPNPKPQEETLTVDDVTGVPPANLDRLFDALKAELDAFLRCEPFNSRLRLSRNGIDVGNLRDHLRHRDGHPYVEDAAMLVLDATPHLPLVDHLLANHPRRDTVTAAVSLPPNVHVVQYVGRTNGHSSLRSESTLQSLLDEVKQERARFPVASPEDEAVICYRRMRPHFLDMGFPDSHVLTFGSVRGTNVVAAVKRLHVVGRPMPPNKELPYLAQVIFHDGPAISEKLVLRPASYGGQPFAIDVVDYADDRVADLVKASREDELTQVVHRARLLAMVSQPSIEEAPDRVHVRLVLHTSHPVPGLRVDELVMSESVQPDSLNVQRKTEAKARIIAAWESLKSDGQTPSINAVAKLAGASWRTVNTVLGKVLHTPKEDQVDSATTPTRSVASEPAFGKVLHTLKGDADDGELNPSGASQSQAPPRTSPGTPLHTHKEDLLKGVQNLPKSDVGLILPEGDPCPCVGCDACRTGFDLHFQARIPVRFERRRVCRWCELKGGTAA